MPSCNAKVDRLAAGLLTLGLEPGDRIGIWSPNNAEWVLTQFATAKAGLILVNINPAYRIAELEYALNKVGCKALILAERFKTSDYIGMLRELAPELGRCDAGQAECGAAAAAALGRRSLATASIAGTFAFRRHRGARRACRSGAPRRAEPRSCNSTSRSTSSSPAARPAFPKARRCRTTTSSTTASSSARRCG